MVLRVVLEQRPCRVAHFRVSIEPVLNLQLRHIWAEARPVTHDLLWARQRTVIVKQHVEPKRHLVSIMLGSPVMNLLQ
jgi:hypothetical protein